MSKHEIKKFHSKQDTTYVLDNGSTLFQLNPPIDFFFQNGCHIFLYGIIEENENQKKIPPQGK